MDPAAEFLHRHERKALQKALRGEKLLAIAPARMGDRAGLVAATRTRLLFAARKRIGAKARAWSRAGIVAMSEEKRRYGILHVRMRSGEHLRFEMMASHGTTIILDAWRPPRKPVDPVKAALPRRPRQTKRPTARRPTAPALDPLAHRGSIDHQAKLLDMVQRGLMTKAEMEWQLGR